MLWALTALIDTDHVLFSTDSPFMRRASAGSDPPFHGGRRSTVVNIEVANTEAFS
jgi:hypothetical protein